MQGVMDVCSDAVVGGAVGEEGERSRSGAGARGRAATTAAGAPRAASAITRAAERHAAAHAPAAADATAATAPASKGGASRSFEQRQAQKARHSERGARAAVAATWHTSSAGAGRAQRAGKTKWGAGRARARAHRRDMGEHAWGHSSSSSATKAGARCGMSTEGMEGKRSRGAPKSYDVRQFASGIHDTTKTPSGRPGRDFRQPAPAWRPLL